MRHAPVLLNEVVENLNLKSGDNAVDCTLGDGGHAEAILNATGPDGKLLGIDADSESLLRAKRYLYGFGNRVVFERDNFSNLEGIVEKNNFINIKGILMDLGWASPQFEERNRGFSFDKDEPLDMRFDPNSAGQTAAEVLNESGENELVKIFKNFGEEKFAESIAQEIVNERGLKPVERTSQLAEIVLRVYRKILKSDNQIPWIGGIHPATKVFQALRIVVNSELEVLKQALPQALAVLEAGGRLAVISFHSLEDRIVKHFFQSAELKIITKKPIIASETELAENPRARSAKLRVIEKI